MRASSAPLSPRRAESRALSLRLAWSRHWLPLAACLLCWLSAHAITISAPITAACEFAVPRLQLVGAYTHVSVEGCDPLQRVGAPVLPFRTIRLLLPPGAKVATIQARSPAEPVPITGRHLVDYGRMPITTPGTAAADATAAAAPDQTIYSSDQLYPATAVELVSVQRLAGFDIAFLRVYPVRYEPAKGALYFTPRLEVVLMVEVDPAESKALIPPPRLQQSARSRLATWVDNPALLDTYATTPITEKAGDRFDYLLITSSNLVSAFQPMVDLKMQNGLAVKVETVEAISTSQSGVDLPEKIRNYLRYAYTNWGITYVLLGGDTTTVPCRYGYVSVGSVVQSPLLPTDLYYACLDGSWNSDGDSRWGEPTDGDGGGAVDVLAELYVGRAPVDSVAEADIVVHKAVRYATQTHANVTNALFLSEFLTDTPTGPAQGGDMFDPLVPLFAGYEVTWLDDRPHTTPQWDKTDALNALSESPHVALFNGHGFDNTLIGYNYPFFRSIETPDLASLTNAWPFLAYSLGCNVGQFDNDRFSPDSIGEELVKAHSRGAFAAVLNSREGLYDSQDEVKYSGEFQRQFFHHLLVVGHTNLGAANQLSKEDLLGRLETAGIMAYRWCYYEITLLGDPHLAWQPPSETEAPTDTDGDGMADADEAIAGTDPDNAASVLRLRVIPSGSGEGTRLEWPSAGSRTYSVWAASQLSVGGFTLLASNLLATPPTNVFQVDEPTTQTEFYRVSVQTAN